MDSYDSRWESKLLKTSWTTSDKPLKPDPIEPQAIDPRKEYRFTNETLDFNRTLFHELVQLILESSNRRRDSRREISQNVLSKMRKPTQLQSQKAHAQYHMIQQITSEEDVSDTELLHVPIWFVRYDHSGTKIVLVIDGNSFNVINSLGL